MNRKLLVMILVAGLWSPAFPCQQARAEDWPVWRHDAQHTAASKQQLASELHLQWVREYPRQKTAWLDQPQLTFDRNCEPVVLGTTLFFGSARNDTLTALDTRTGAEKWVFYTDGPIRFAPAAWDGKVYFVSDDGHLYCVNADSGKLLWKFRGGPSDRKILGNGRLISIWPARGAPVIADGTVYFAASIWPFMGIFIHALDARTGEVVWTNDGDGSLYLKQPHNADSFAGIAPQGPLVVAGDKLLIPGGRSVPACYDRKTGKMLHFQLAENARLGGGAEVGVLGNLVFNGGAIFDLQSGTYLGPFGKQPLDPRLTAPGEGMQAGANLFPIGKLPTLADDMVVGFAGAKYQVFDPRKCKVELTDTVDRRGAKTQQIKWTMAKVDTHDAPALEVVIRSGNRLYAASPRRIEAVELPLPSEKGEKPVVSWTATVEGTPVSLLSADDRLFAVTLEGQILCFGADKEDPKAHKLEQRAVVTSDAAAAKARSILETTKVRDGYCICWGVKEGQLIAELARQSDLYILAVDADIEKVRVVRRRLTEAGVYGYRVAVYVGDPLTFPLPPYLAGLIVAEDLRAAHAETGAAFARKTFHSLRPYGGVACFEMAPAKRKSFVKLVGEADLPNAKVRESSDFLLLSREGALPGAADWTHEQADAANTRVSGDRVVKTPLGVLWFGGSSNEGILPRHGHGPQPQVIDGRLIIEGIDMLRAMDIYTGRVLWETKLLGIGKIYNNLSHQPGANATGSNYVSTPDGIYVVYEKSCLRLDPATGRKLDEFHLPALTKAKEPLPWGYLNVAENYLVGGADPLLIDPKEEALPRQLELWNIEERKVIASLAGHTDQVTSVAFSPDGKTLATASNDTTIRLWDGTSGKTRGALQGHTKRVLGVAFSPDGKTLATASEDATVLLWDLASRKRSATLKKHTGPVTCLAFSPDGKTLATGSTDSTVILWNPRTEELVTILEGFTDDVSSLAFSPDGKTLATGSADMTVKLWDLDEKAVRVTLEKHTGPVLCLAFSPDGKTLATGSRDKTVQLWEAASGRAGTTLEGQGSPVTCVGYSPDGKTLAAGTLNANIYLWDTAEKKVRTTLSGLPGSARSVAFAPDGKTLAMGGQEVIARTQNESLSSSKRLVVMDRHTGKVLWSVNAQNGFRHNSICIGGGRLYCIDRLSAGELVRLKRRGQTPPSSARLLALDLATGREVWSTEADVFGTSLSFAAKHDVLIEAGRPAGDTLWDEAKGIRAFHAGTGKVLWHDKSYLGPVMIHRDTIIASQSAYDLLTGKQKVREDPITGKPVPWTWTRNHGCNTPVGCEHLLTFRSGAAGYCDLANDGGTGNFGGFRSSCSNNLIAAGGLLNAPDYTRSCTCGYQNQCSLALLPMPEVEVWTKFPVEAARPATAPLDPEKAPPTTPVAMDKIPKPIKHLALNLGAPGHRRADDGRLWLNEYEHAKVKFEGFGFYNGHSSRIKDATGSWPWVVASGCRGITELELTRKVEEGEGADGARYTVRLHFADPDNDKAGERVFNIKLQGQEILSKFDIAKEVGGKNRAVVKEFKGVKVRDKLLLQFEPAGTSPLTAATTPLLSGVELVREDD